MDRKADNASVTEIYLSTAKKYPVPEFIDQSLLASEELNDAEIPLNTSFIIDLIENANKKDGQYSTDGDIGCFQADSFQPMQLAPKKKTDLHLTKHKSNIKDEIDCNFLSIEDLDEEAILQAERNQYVHHIPNGAQIDYAALPAQVEKRPGEDFPDYNKLSKDEASFLFETNEKWINEERLYRKPLEFDDLETNLRAKRTLPHKKRITNKLKNIASPSPNDGASTSYIDPANIENINYISSFTCQLCGICSESQMDFFAHLKGHYEPTQMTYTDKIFQTIDESATTALLIHPESAKPSDIISTNFFLLKSDFELKDSAETVREHIYYEEKPAGGGCVNTMLEINETEHEVEFSDTEDLLEGYRGIVNKHVHELDNTCDVPDLKIDHLVDKVDFSDFVGTPKPEDDFHAAPPSDFADEPTPSSTSSKKPKCKQEDNILEEGYSKKRYKCDKCGKELNSCNALKYHILSHSGERAHQCDICGKSFFASSALKAHLRVHTGDKPYKCQECNRLFRQWGDLKYHMTSLHSAEKNFTCEFCGKSFSRKYSLVVHRRIHTRERNYKCEFCAKTFRASSYLQNHRKIHTGEKPFECDICSKKFRVSSDLRRHKKTHERSRPVDSTKQLTKNIVTKVRAV